MMRYSLLIAIIICILVGALGGASSALVINAPLGASILLGMLYGLIFALFGASRAVSPGAGLLWGLGYSFVLWLAIPEGIVPVLMGGMPSMGMLDTARAHFPELVAYTLCFGAPLGLALGTWGLWNAECGMRIDGGTDISNPQSAIRNPQSAFSWPRALVVGGLAGIFGGWAFGKWMAGQFLPAHRRIGQLRFDNGWYDASLCLRRDHRRELRRLIPTRRARLRIVHGLGRRLRIVLVVSWAAGDYAALARRPTGLVLQPGERPVRLARRPCDLRGDRRLDLCGARQTMGRVLQRLRPDQPRTRRDWLALPVFTEVGRGGESGGRLSVFAGDDGRRVSAESGGTGRRRVAHARLRGSHAHQRVDRNEIRSAVSLRSARFRIGRGMGPGLWLDLVVCRAADLDANFAGLSKNRSEGGSQRARDAARKQSLGPARNALGKHIAHWLSRPSGRVGAPGTAQSDERGSHGLPCPERSLRV